MTFFRAIYLNKLKIICKVFPSSRGTFLNFWPFIFAGGESGNKTGCEQTKTNRKIEVGIASRHYWNKAWVV